MSAPWWGQKQSAVLLALATLQVTLLAYGAVAAGPVADEPAHLVAGLCVWKTGKYDVYCVNPPLVRQVAALPAFVIGTPSSLSLFGGEDAGQRTEFARGRSFVRENGIQGVRLIVYGRLACVPFAILGLIVTVAWAERLYGPPAGLVAGLLWCFSPTVLGHGALITADCAATSLGLLATYRFAIWLEEGSWTSAILAGASLGFALLAKTLWIFLLLLWPVLFVCWHACSRFHQPCNSTGFSKGAWRVAVAQLAANLAIGLFVCNSWYLGHGTFKRLREYEFQSLALAGNDSTDPPSHNRFADTWLGQVPVPLPEAYVRGIDLQRVDFENYPPSYLRGELSTSGWWYYYVYAFLIKEPLAVSLLILGACVVTTLRRMNPLALQQEVVLLATTLFVLVLVSSQTKMNHHFRYLMPALPGVFIFASKCATFKTRWRNVQRWLVGGALAWGIASVLCAYPYTIGYFNEAVGGWQNGWRHLHGSNTDWGQGVYALKAWCDRHPERRPLYLAHYKYTVDPVIFGVNYRPMLPTNQSSHGEIFHSAQHGPLTGWHVISMNALLRHGEYDYLHQCEPVESIAGCYLVYDLGLDEVNSIRERCGLPPVDASGAPREISRVK